MLLLKHKVLVWGVVFMLKDKKILIVEDSISFRQIIKAMLKDTGAIISEAGSEFGMYNLIENYGTLVDIIIMDLYLKYENGLNLIEKLNRTDRYKDIPVIIITQHTRKHYVFEAKKLGVKHYIKKPINKTILIDRLTEVLTV